MSHDDLIDQAAAVSMRAASTPWSCWGATAPSRCAR
jgi:hypothetical protein